MELYSGQTNRRAGTFYQRWSSQSRTHYIVLESKPNRAPSSVAPSLPWLSLCKGWLFVLERLTEGCAGTGPARSEPTLNPSCLVLLCSLTAGLVWTAAPVCFLRGKLSPHNHWPFLWMGSVAQTGGSDDIVQEALPVHRRALSIFIFSAHCMV